MKKVIDGKIYDTETAIGVALYQNRFAPYKWDSACGSEPYLDGKLTAISECLYLTRKRNWFLCRESGQFSRWKESLFDQDREEGPVLGIVPLTVEEVKQWFAGHGDVVFVDEMAAHLVPNEEA